MLGEKDARLVGVRLIVGEWAHASLFSANVYALGERSVTLVDAGDAADVGSLLLALGRLGLRVEDVVQVVLTHSHDDHWGALTRLLKMVSLRVLAYKDDIPFYEGEFGKLDGLKEYRLIGLSDGDVVEAGGRRLRVLHTPGHDRGAICLVDEERRILWSGDTVFASGTTGSLRSGGSEELKASLKRLGELDVDIMLPGHGVVLLGGAQAAVRLAWERLTWMDRVPEDAPYWLWPRLYGARRGKEKEGGQAGKSGERAGGAG